MIRYGVIVAAIVAAPAGLHLLFGDSDQAPATRSEIRMPVVEGATAPAAGLFASACGDCHGAYGQGTQKGPMLVHSLYAPDIFPDDRIRTAILAGARARHWPFGEMPAIDGVDGEAVDALVAFVRTAQEANGIK